MLISSSWLKRKKASICILAAICASALFVIINTNEKTKSYSGGSYVVRIKHYGIDAAEMEKTVTIPLEDALFSIPGVMGVQSSSENSHSSVFVRFKSGTYGCYEAVRDAAQRVYETLPSSAQRPEILSSNNSRSPVWSASVMTDNSDDELISQMLEKIVKPRLESLEGTGEVLVSGTGIKEIYITLDQEKLASLGLEPITTALVLANNDSIYSGGTIIRDDNEITITVDGRYDFFSLGDALIPFGEGKYVSLSDIAAITEQEREPDILSRLNGRKTASIAIMGRDSTDLRKLSSDIKKELEALALPLEFIVLSDLGAEEASAFHSVLTAALSGAIMVAVICFLLNRKNNFYITGFFCALAIPLTCLLSIAVLSIAGFSLDRVLLAGIAAGVGVAIDAVILCSEKLRKCSNYDSAATALTSLAGPLTAGAATTVAALLPLTAINDINVKIIASAIMVITLTALVLSLSFLPPLLLWNISSQKKQSTIIKPHIFMKLQLRLSYHLCRFLAATVKFCTRYSILVLSTGLVITISAILMLFAKGVDTSSYTSEDSVYGQVEFDGGLLAEEIDRLLASYSEQLVSHTGIINVETGARTGSGSLLISFDPKQTQAHLVRDLAKQIYIPGGFIFFHENSINDRYWEIFVYGDEDKKCRELAEMLAFLCANHPLINERVLNFKQGSKKMVLIPDRDIFAETNLMFSAAANRIRMGVYGPVAYKRITQNGETDVRIRTGSNNMASNNLRQSREGALGILVSAVNEEKISTLRVDSLMQIKEDTEPSSIRRDNRRRFASITISTKPMDARRVNKELSVLFSKMDLPPGYSIEFDPEAIRQSEALSSTVLSLIMAVLFCYMIIASINESFSVPLIVLCAIPPSLAIPALFLVLTGSAYNSSVACAFIAVSGMTVNAAILCVDGVRAKIKAGKEKTALNIYLAIREKMPALLSTTGTTIAGAIPFIFLTEGANTLIRTLSIVGALGITSSCLCSITIIPSILFFSRNSRKSQLQKKILPVQDVN